MWCATSPSDPLEQGQDLTASGLLERFLFDKEQQYQYVSTLSGGEKRRLYLCTVLMKNPNVLILDEPTNDLDIPTLNAWRTSSPTSTSAC
jgi:ATP-binding cassette subfamily F protein uup